jgi:4-amino-4-deoxy-L-arabinose transferase-like glycosyltransferase
MSVRRVDPTTAGALVVAALAVTLLVTVGIDQILGYDSFWHVFVARQDRWPNFWREIGLNAHPPLFYLLLRAADQMFGHALLVYRLVSVTAIAASILLLARIVHRLSGSSAVAIAAAAAFGLSFTAFDIGLEVRAYALNLAWMLAAFLLFVDWMSLEAAAFPAWKRWMLALTLSAALLTNYSAAFFLAGAGLTIVLLWLGHAQWRRRLGDEFRRHGVSAVAMFSVPVLVAAPAYLIHAASWAGRLNHVPAFMYYPDSESAVTFLTRTGQTLATLFFPATGFDVPVVPVTMTIGLVLLALAVRAVRRQEIGAVAMVLFGLMLALNVAAALAGRYPFGGTLRHESFLFPFLVIAVFVGLESARRAVPLRWAAPRVWVGLSAVMIALNVASWLSQVQLDTSTMMAGSLRAFRTGLGTPETIATDQFNFIIVFANHHYGDWRLRWEPPGGGTPQVWDVTGGGGEHITVCRLGGWQADLSKPSLYSEVAACVERSGAARVALFSPQQPQIASSRPTDIEEAAAARLARDATLAVDTLIVHGGDIFAGFQPMPTHGRLQVLLATYGGNCGAGAGNATAVVSSSCGGRAGVCAFQIKVEELGDPSPGCAKDFVVVFTCGGEVRRSTVPAEAGFGSTVRLACTS